MRALCCLYMCVSSLQFFHLLTTLYGILYECYTIGGYPSLVLISYNKE